AKPVEPSLTIGLMPGSASKPTRRAASPSPMNRLTSARMRAIHPAGSIRKSMRFPLEIREARRSRTSPRGASPGLPSEARGDKRGRLSKRSSSHDQRLDETRHELSGWQAPAPSAHGGVEPNAGARDGADPWGSDLADLRGRGTERTPAGDDHAGGRAAVHRPRGRGGERSARARHSGHGAVSQH